MTTQNPTAAPPVTLEEYAALPQRPRYELVKGVLIEQMGASDEHEETVALVIWRLSSHVYPSRLGRVYSSNRGYVTVPDSPASSRMPDVSFLSAERAGQPDLFGMLYDGSPDLAVEILSPSNTIPEINQKIVEYLKQRLQVGMDYRHPYPYTHRPHCRCGNPNPLRRRHRVRRRCPAGIQLPGRRPAAVQRLDRRRPPSQRRPIGQRYHRFQVVEPQKPAHRKINPVGDFRQPRGQQQLDFLISRAVVSIQVAPPPHIGIDRYLHRLAGSTSPAQHVKDSPASPGPDEPRGLRRNFQLSCHIDIHAVPPAHPEPVEGSS